MSRHQQPENPSWQSVQACLVWPKLNKEFTENIGREILRIRRGYEPIEKLRVHIRDPEGCLNSSFTTVDKDGDRIITREELKKAINRGMVYPRHIKDRDFQELLLILDPNHTNWIKCNRFLELFSIDPHPTPLNYTLDNGNQERTLTLFDIDDRLREFVKPRTQQMLRDFSNHDVDNSGNVKKPHAKYIIQKHCFPISDSEFEGLWKTFPINGPEELRYFDFLQEYGNMTRTPRPTCERSWIPHKLKCLQYGADDVQKYRTSQPWSTVPQVPDADVVLRNLVGKKWREIIRRCRYADTRRIGYITAEGLKDVLGQCGLPVNISIMEDLLKWKYGLIRGTVLNYWTFIRKCGYYHGSSESDLTSDVKTDDVLDAKGRSTPYKILLAMRGQVLHYWRRIRQRFREKDPGMTGYLDGCDFRKILHDYCIYMNDEEYFKLLQYFDPHMTGQIPYTSFLQTYANPLLY